MVQLTNAYQTFVGKKIFFTNIITVRLLHMPVALDHIKN